MAIFDVRRTAQGGHEAHLHFDRVFDRAVGDAEALEAAVLFERVWDGCLRLAVVCPASREAVEAVELLLSAKDSYDRKLPSEGAHVARVT